MNIYLIGFMGVGKSTVAKELSERLDRRLVDTDSAIEAKEQRTISEIFNSDGEEYFRGLERELIRELASDNNLIVSCGGGIIKSDDNIRIMKDTGHVILLEASPDTIYDRVKDDNTRPLLKDNSGVSYIKKLLEERNLLYNKAYTDKVDANGTVQRVTDDIIELL